MKKTLLFAMAALGMAMAPGSPKGDKLTLKERIDQVKEIKVYFSNADIKHNPNTNGMPGSQKKGTSCPAFTETTPLPVEYADAAKQVIDLLNKGFNTTVFVEGDFSKVPVVTSGMLKGSSDWVALGEPLTVLVSSGGNYNVENMGLMGEVSLENSMDVYSSFAVYGIVEGKTKVLENKNLVSKITTRIKTKGCDDYAYFVKNFPVASLLEDFKAGIAEKTTDFATKQMADYEKAMKKKK
jgi:hypothetical protein